jgi:hypothetical protein
MKILRQLILLSIISIPALSISYSTKVLPYQEYTVEADLSGKIIVSNFELEHKTLKKETNIIKIDNKPNLLKQIYLKKQYKNMEEIYKLKTKNLSILLKSKNKNEYEKNKAKQDLLNLQNNLFSIKQNIEIIEDDLKKRNISIPAGMYLSKVYVIPNEYVMNGKKLFKYIDIKKIKLRVYVIKKDYQEIEKKEIYINDEINKDFYINKISKITDEDKLGTFEIELISKNKQNYVIGEIVSIKFKDKDEN